jgi:hypothetical protein
LLALAAVAFALFAVPDAGFGQVIPKPRPAITESKVAPKAEKAKTYDHGSVYLLRGLANIFSLGMNTLAKELEKRGVETVVTNHSHGFDIVDKLAKQYETDKSVLPIIIIGHSLGGNKTLTMAARLAEKNVPVRLLVIFDATVAHPVPLNVQEVLNLYKSKSVGKVVAGAAGYKGVIDNKDVSDIPGVGHISIDKSKQLHAEVIEKVLAVLSEDQAPKKKAPKKKPMIEEPVAKAPETPPAETATPEAKTPEVMETKAPETEAKTPEVTETKAPEPEAKTPEVTETKTPEPETKTPEVTEAKAPEAVSPVVVPEAKPSTETPATATN